MNEKWKQQAIENQNRVRDMLHSVESEYVEDPDKLLGILKVGTSFYQYSLNNMKLIYLQKPDATYIQSFEAWKKMGVSVQKGQKGIKIFVPVRTTMLILEDGALCPLSDATAEQRELYHKGLLKAQSKISYKIGNVFDISQTNFPEERRTEFAFEEEPLYDKQQLLQISNDLMKVLPDSSISVKERFENVCTGIIMQIHLNQIIPESMQEVFIACFRRYEMELRKQHPEYSRNDMTKILDESLAGAFKNFRNHISQTSDEKRAVEMIGNQKFEEKPVEDNTKTVAHKNYEAIMEFASDVLTGKVEYAKYDAGECFDKLSIEKIGPNMIAMAHRFEQNGDLVADPDMEFEVDHEKKTLNARSFQNEVFAKYSCVIREDGSIDTRLEAELNNFANTWLRNIKMQGYKLIVPDTAIQYFTLNLGGTGVGEDTVPIVHNDVESAIKAYLASDRDGKKIGIRVSGKDIIISEFDMVSYKNNIVIPKSLLSALPGDIANELEENMNQIRSKLDEDNLRLLSEAKSTNITDETVQSDNASKKYFFEVLECSEYPSMGKIYPDILNVKDALEQFEIVMKLHSNMIPGINLVIKTEGSDIEESRIPLTSGRNIDLTMLQYYQEFKEDKTVREKVEDFIKKAKESGFQTYGKCTFGEPETAEMNHRRRHGR